MSTKRKSIDWILAILTFLLPLIIFKITSVNALMFDDAAEFALVIKLGSIAHPPGTPAYIFFARLWEQCSTIFHLKNIESLNLFSSFCISLSSLLLYFTFIKIGKEISGTNSTKQSIVAASCAIAFSTGSTTWAWANTIEVYSFQVLSMAITLIGLTYYQITKEWKFIVTAGVGIGLGLANHHLTMIAFLPFTFLFFTNDLFKFQLQQTKKNKTASTTIDFFSIIRSKSFILLVLISATVTFTFYFWMYLRAQHEYPFMFGKPDTLGGMFYHLKGGSYSKNLSSASSETIASRFPYFIKLTFDQLYLFLPFFLLGIYVLIKNRKFRLTTIILTYFSLLFLYQLKNNQWSSTDAYMLLPFLILTIPVFIGALVYVDKLKLHFIFPILLLLQLGINFTDHNRRTYPVSDGLMELLDKSAPKNSVVLVSDWSTVIQYYYFRIVENFRTDLVVLNYDMKFTHYRILPILYPSFYKKIKPEYDNFISELKKEHPEQVSNTGCDLNTIPLNNSFRTLVLKIENNCKAENINFLTDPKTHYLYSEQKFYSPNRYVSGCFMSTIPGDSISAATFLPLDLQFLKSPLLLNDPSSLDKIVDFQAMLDSHINFYKANNNTEKEMLAEDSKNRILQLQRKLKKSMSFAFKVK